LSEAGRGEPGGKQLLREKAHRRIVGMAARKSKSRESQRRKKCFFSRKSIPSKKFQDTQDTLGGKERRVHQGNIFEKFSLLPRKKNRTGRGKYLRKRLYINYLEG